MASDTYAWTIHTTNGESYVAVFGQQELHNLTDGETATFDFRFPKSGENLVVESGETYTIEAGTTEIYYEVTVEGGGTLTVNGTLIVTEGTFENLQEYDQEADNFVEHETVNNNHKFSNQLPSNSDVDSLLLGIEPSQKLKDNNVKGIYGMLTGATDNRNRPLTETNYELELWKLADFDEYSSITDVENDLEV